MHHFLSRIAAAAVAAGLAACLSPATAAPLPSLESVAGQAGSVELVGRRHHHGHWRPYRYNYGFYGYRYRPYYYGYHYRPYYWWYRPWYGPWW